MYCNGLVIIDELKRFIKVLQFTIKKLNYEGEQVFNIIL